MQPSADNEHIDLLRGWLRNLGELPLERVEMYLPIHHNRDISSAFKELHHFLAAPRHRCPVRFVGQHVHIKLTGGRIEEATIKAVVIQMTFGSKWSPGRICSGEQWTTPKSFPDSSSDRIPEPSAMSSGSGGSLPSLPC